MKPIRSLLTPLFNQEILRVAKQRNKATEEGIKDLLLEIASDCNVKLRAIYHWRSGRHSIPSDLLPVICKRLGSNVLMEEMNRLRAQIEVEVPEEYDLARLAAHSIREDMEVYEQILIDFETEGIQPGEFERLLQLAARSHGNLHHLIAIAEADCQRRMELAPRKPSQRSALRSQDSKLQISDSRKTGTR